MLLLLYISININHHIFSTVKTLVWQTYKYIFTACLRNSSLNTWIICPTCCAWAWLPMWSSAWSGWTDSPRWPTWTCRVIASPAWTTCSRWSHLPACTQTTTSSQTCQSGLPRDSANSLRFTFLAIESIALVSSTYTFTTSFYCYYNNSNYCVVLNTN